MQHQNYVVVWDPSGTYWEGGVVPHAKALAIEDQGGCVLPCDPETFLLAGFSGYARRAWGSGYPLDSASPELSAPFAIHLPDQDHRVVHWAARLVPGSLATERLAAGHSASQGIVRLAAGVMRLGQSRPTIAEGEVPKNVVNVGKLGQPDQDGGWNIKGEARIYCPGEGTYALALYAAAPGMRVVWTAATLTR